MIDVLKRDSTTARQEGGWMDEVEEQARARARDAAEQRAASN